VLLDVPPVSFITRGDPFQFRVKMARFVDGRNVNDILYRAMLAIRTECELEPRAYMVWLPELAAEIPIDIRPIVDEAGFYAGIVAPPRSLHEAPFNTRDADPEIARLVEGLSREPAIQILKNRTSDGGEITLPDLSEDGPRFCHVFRDGLYRHSYRTVATFVPEINRS
jgi:hypothetical protein